MNRKKLVCVTAIVSGIIFLGLMGSLVLAKPTPSVVLTFINDYTGLPVTNSPIGVETNLGTTTYVTDYKGRITIKTSGAFTMGQTYDVFRDWGYPFTPDYEPIGSFTVKSNGITKELIWYPSL